MSHTMGRTRSLMRSATIMLLLAAISGAACLPRPSRAEDHEEDLLANGDFEAEEVEGRRPGWEPFTMDGIAVVDSASPRGRVLRFELNEQVAATSGMMAYSEAIPVTQGETYRLRVDIKSEKPTVILFVKGYTDFRGEERVIYKRQMHSRVGTGKWGTMDLEFTPRSPMGQKVLAHRKLDVPTVDRVKVMLYAYHPKGVVYFDNVRVTKAPESTEADDAASSKTESP